MRTRITVGSRGAITLPLELYTDKRVREFDEAEAELARALPSAPAASVPKSR